jgi:catalase
MNTDTPKETPKASTVVRAVAAAACVLAGSQSAAAQSELGAQLVDDLQTAFGKRHARAVHAKGVILEGSFMPARAAPALSKAAVFAGGPVAVTARFSDFSATPDVVVPASE